MIESNTTPPVLHQKYNSETSSHDTNNNEIYYPKVTSKKNYSFLVPVICYVKHSFKSLLRRSKVLLQTSSSPGQICRSIFWLFSKTISIFFNFHFSFLHFISAFPSLQKKKKEKKKSNNNNNRGESLSSHFFLGNGAFVHRLLSSSFVIQLSVNP